MNPASERGSAADYYHRAAITLNDLEPGDIVGTASTTKGSTGTQWTTDSPFSHVILYRGSGWAIDAMPGSGVTLDPLADKVRGIHLAAVFRHSSASIEKREMAVKWAALQTDKPYDTVGAGRLGLRPGSRFHFARYGLLGLTYISFDEARADLSEDGHDASFFCSELIFRGYEVAGAPLVDTPSHLVSPGKLLKSKVLAHMGDLVNKARGIG